MNNKKNVFLTGITGFLGSFLAAELLKKGYKVYGLARGKGGKSAKERVVDALKFAFYEDEWDVELVNKNVEVVEGDIVEEDLGIAPSKREELAQIINVIFHSAALTELNVPIDVIRKPNVEGTRHVLNLAMECKEKGRLRKFNHISTMYVCGDHEGEFDETMLDMGQSFNNSYEQSKYEAEVLIQEFIGMGLNVAVYRPSLIMGDSKTGKTNNFRLFYQPLGHFVKEFFEVYPADPRATQNLINMDTVALAVIDLMDSNKMKCFHIISPNEIKVEEFMRYIVDFFKFQPPELIPLEKFDHSQLSTVLKNLAMPFAPYFNSKVVFKFDQTESALGKRLIAVDKENIFTTLQYYKKFVIDH